MLDEKKRETKATLTAKEALQKTAEMQRATKELKTKLAGTFSTPYARRGLKADDKAGHGDRFTKSLHDIQTNMYGDEAHFEKTRKKHLRVMFIALKRMGVFDGEAKIVGGEFKPGPFAANKSFFRGDGDAKNYGEQFAEMKDLDAVALKALSDKLAALEEPLKEKSYQGRSALGHQDEKKDPPVLPAALPALADDVSGKAKAARLQEDAVYKTNEEQRARLKKAVDSALALAEWENRLVNDHGREATLNATHALAGELDGAIARESKTAEEAGVTYHEIPDDQNPEEYMMSQYASGKAGVIYNERQGYVFTADATPGDVRGAILKLIRAHSKDQALTHITITDLSAENRVIVSKLCIAAGVSVRFNESRSDKYLDQLDRNAGVQIARNIFAEFDRQRQLMTEEAATPEKFSDNKKAAAEQQRLRSAAIDPVRLQVKAFLSPELMGAGWHQLQPHPQTGQDVMVKDVSPQTENGRAAVRFFVEAMSNLSTLPLAKLIEGIHNELTNVAGEFKDADSEKLFKQKMHDIVYGLGENGVAKVGKMLEEHGDILKGQVAVDMASALSIHAMHPSNLYRISPRRLFTKEEVKLGRELDGMHKAVYSHLIVEDACGAIKKPIDAMLAGFKDGKPTSEGVDAVAGILRSLSAQQDAEAGKSPRDAVVELLADQLAAKAEEAYRACLSDDPANADQFPAEYQTKIDDIIARNPRLEDNHTDRRVVARTLFQQEAQTQLVTVLARSEEKHSVYSMGESAGSRFAKSCDLGRVRIEKAYQDGVVKRFCEQVEARYREERGLGPDVELNAEQKAEVNARLEVRANGNGAYLHQTLLQGDVMREGLVRARSADCQGNTGYTEFRALSGKQQRYMEEVAMRSAHQQEDPRVVLGA